MRDRFEKEDFDERAAMASRIAYIKPSRCASSLPVGLI